MDLNELLRRNQRSLLLADEAANSEQRRAHDQFARDYSLRLGSFRSEMGATKTPRSGE